MNDVREGASTTGTRASKGMAYVEFEDVASVPAALATTGQILRNQVVMVKASAAELRGVGAREEEKQAAASVAA